MAVHLSQAFCYRSLSCSDPVIIIFFGVSIDLGGAQPLLLPYPLWVSAYSWIYFMECHCFWSIHFFRLFCDLGEFCHFGGGNEFSRAAYELLRRGSIRRLFAYYIQILFIDYYALAIDLRYVSCWFSINFAEIIHGSNLRWTKLELFLSLLRWSLDKARMCWVFSQGIDQPSI